MIYPKLNTPTISKTYINRLDFQKSFLNRFIGSSFDSECPLACSGSGRVAISYNALLPKFMYVYEFELSSFAIFIILLAVSWCMLIDCNHLPNSPCAKSFSFTCFNLRPISKIDWPAYSHFIFYAIILTLYLHNYEIVFFTATQDVSQRLKIQKNATIKWRLKWNI